MSSSIASVDSSFASTFLLFLVQFIAQVGKGLGWDYLVPCPVESWKSLVMGTLLCASGGCSSDWSHWGGDKEKINQPTSIPLAAILFKHWNTRDSFSFSFRAVWSPSWSSFGSSPVCLRLWLVRTRTGHGTLGTAWQVLSRRLITFISASNAPADAGSGSSLPLLQQCTVESCSACLPGSPTNTRIPHKSQPVLGSLVISGAGPCPCCLKLCTILARPLLDLASFLPADPKAAGKQLLQRLSQGWSGRETSLRCCQCRTWSESTGVSKITHVESFVLVLPLFIE